MAAGLGCEGLTSGDDEPVAIVIVNPPSSIDTGQTLPITARALNRSGDTIPGLTPALISQNPDTLVADSVTGTITGRLKGTGRLVAAVGSTQSEILQIPVVAP